VKGRTKRAWSQAAILVGPKSILQEDLSPTGLRLYLALASFCRDDETCWPSNRAILELLPPGTTERTVQKAKTELIQAGLLSVEPREAKGGRQTSNLYTLLYHQEGEGEQTDTPEPVQADTPEDAQVDTPRTKNRNGNIRKKDVELVFQSWVTTTDKSGRTRLDDKRRRAIERALTHYPLAEVLEAVEGWANSPFHRGQNDQGKVYDEITMILRDSGQIEKFRDLARDKAAGKRAGAKPASWDILQELAKRTPVDAGTVSP
jgi:hypothetical protein